jgi:hypothetical protein
MPQTPTAHLPTLLKRYEALTREIAAREADRVAVHDQILAAGRGGPRRSVPSPGPGRPARTTAQTVEVVRDTVRVLREAGTPLPRREVATLDRLGVAAYIPFKDNAVVNPKSPAWSRHLCEFLLNQERFLPHYHRRSNVETVFAMIKAKFGAAVRARSPVAQVNEVLTKCVAHNLCCVAKAIFTAGLEPTFWPDAVATVRGES